MFCPLSLSENQPTLPHTVKSPFDLSLECFAASVLNRIIITAMGEYTTKKTKNRVCELEVCIRCVKVLFVTNKVLFQSWMQLLKMY